MFVANWVLKLKPSATADDSDNYMFQKIIKTEWRNLFAEKSFLILAVVFALLIAYGISSGANWIGERRTQSFDLLAAVFSQTDGKIVEREEYTFSTAFVGEITKTKPAEKPIFENTKIKKITYLSDNLKIKGFVAMPKKAGKFPVIIYNRGGNREFGQLNEFELYFMAKFADWGYVVIGSQYRGCCGSEGKDEFGGKDLNDVLNLIPALNDIPEADAGRIGMWGWSRGGMMTFLALTQTDKIRAAVVGAPAINQFSNLKRKDGVGFEKSVFAELIPDYAQNKDAELKKRSPVFWTEKIPKTVPILLMQGSSDWRVLAEDTFGFIEKLYRQKNPVKLIFYPGADHGIREYRDETNEQTKAWFDKYVRDKSPLPDMELHGR